MKMLEKNLELRPKVFQNAPDSRTLFYSFIGSWSSSREGMTAVIGIFGFLDCGNVATQVRISALSG